MEQIPSGQSKQSNEQNNEGLLPIPGQPEDIEMPHFFARKEESGEYLEKICLAPAVIQRGKNESEKAYAARILGIVNRIAEENLPTAVNALVEHIQSPDEQRHIIKVIQLQNRVVRTLSGLPFSVRCKGLVILKEALGGLRRNYPQQFAADIMSMFDGTHSVCGYMETRRKELGKRTEFRLNDQLDASHEVDLIEIVKEEGGLVVRLIQCKSSAGGKEIEGLRLENWYAHARWVQRHLLGVHELKANIFGLLEAEKRSHQAEEEPRRTEVLYGDVMSSAKQAQSVNFHEAVSVHVEKILDVLLRISEDSEKTNELPKFLYGESPLTLSLLLFHLLENHSNEEEKKHIIDLVGQALKQAKQPPIFGHPVKRFESVLVIDGESYAPHEISAKARYIGTERNIW
jgi:hypothetical protein